MCLFITFMLNWYKIACKNFSVITYEVYYENNNKYCLGPLFRGV